MFTRAQTDNKFYEKQSVINNGKKYRKLLIGLLSISCVTIFLMLTCVSTLIYDRFSLKNEHHRNGENQTDNLL